MSVAIAIKQPLGFGRSTARVRSSSGRKEAFWIAALTLLHVPISLLVFRVPAIAMLHAWCTLAVGLVLTTLGRRGLTWVQCWVGYVAGIEVIWRMANAPVFWEFGKYSVSLVLLFALIRSQLLGRRWLPVVYFALLMPSVLLTVINSSQAATARALISGNLSGPLALTLCALFFSKARLSVEAARKVFFAVVIPTIGIASITIYATAVASNLMFTENSNKITSGGFGPNQVSSTLGLGALAAWMLITVIGSKLWVKLFAFGAMALLAVQSAMTFSRGGLYNAAGGAALATACLLRDRRSRFRAVLIVVVTAFAVVFFVLPNLDRFTGGALGARFSNIDTSGRREIALADLEIWRDHPLLGVGPGMAKGTRSLYYERAGDNGAHTEFTRLLSEHGLLGFGALVVLLCAGLGNLRRARNAKGRAITAAMLGWSFLYMTNAAMRLVAPSFAFGLACAVLTSDGPRPRRISYSRYASRRSLRRRYTFRKPMNTLQDLTIDEDANRGATFDEKRKRGRQQNHQVPAAFLLGL